MAREILWEEDRQGRTELERLLRHIARRANQGSYRHAELLLNYGFGKPLAIQQNLNVNAEMSQDGMSQDGMRIEQVDAKLNEMFGKMGIPPPVWTPAGRTINIDAVRSEIRELLEKREAAKRPKALPVAGTETVQ